METYTYRIDRFDRITWMSDNWDTFAADNDGVPGSLSSNLHGEKLWDHFADSESVIIYKRLYQRVRKTQQEMLLPIHCDSLDTVRHIEMLAVPLPDSSLEIRFTILSVKKRSLPFEKGGPANSDMMLEMCSYCGNIKNSHGTYIDPVDVIFEEDLFGKPIPRISHTTCPACLDQLMRDLGLSRLEN